MMVNKWQDLEAFSKFDTFFTIIFEEYLSKNFVVYIQDFGYLAIVTSNTHTNHELAFFKDSNDLTETQFLDTIKANNIDIFRLKYYFLSDLKVAMKEALIQNQQKYIDTKYLTIHFIEKDTDFYITKVTATLTLKELIDSLTDVKLHYQESEDASGFMGTFTIGINKY